MLPIMDCPDSLGPKNHVCCFCCRFYWNCSLSSEVTFHCSLWPISFFFGEFKNFKSGIGVQFPWNKGKAGHGIKVSESHKVEHLNSRENCSFPNWSWNPGNRLGPPGQTPWPRLAKFWIRNGKATTGSGVPSAAILNHKSCLHLKKHLQGMRHEMGVSHNNPKARRDNQGNFHCVTERKLPRGEVVLWQIGFLLAAL